MDIQKITEGILSNPGIFAAGRRIFISLVVLVIGGAVIKVSAKLIRKASAGKLKLDATLASMLRMVITYAVIIVCAIMILDAFGINTTSLIAILGAAGVAVGLALKDTLGNIAAGIILLFLRSYRQGDFIEFGSINGTVKEMNLFTTILETGDGVFISAPNASIWGVPLKNYSRNPKRRMDIPVGISYTDSIDAAFQVMKEIIAEEPRFLSSPAPQIVVQSLGDSSVTILLRAWASSGVYWSVYWDQMKNIKEKVEAAGLHIPYPQRDVHIVPSAQKAEAE
jgi:small conductance mechanosensitive channel